MPDAAPQQHLSGQDLARLALNQYKTQTRNNPQQRRQPHQRPSRNVRGVRRDPAALGGVLTQVTSNLGWQPGITGSDITTRWHELCPQYAGRVEPVHYDPDRGTLDLRPSSPAYATQLRLLGGQLAKQINDKLGSTVVRAIRPLPVGTVTAAPTDHTAPAPGTTRQPGPVKTRETASRGYQRARAAIHPRTPAGADPRVAHAVQRQVRDRLREPENSFKEAAIAREETEATEAPDSLITSIQEALNYKHRSGPPVPSAFAT